MNISIPEVGDRVAVYQYVPHEPTYGDMQRCTENPWFYAPSPELKQLRWWGDMPVVAMTRYRKGSEIWVAVTSAEFPEPLRSEGVKVPLPHIEILERGYGLPAQQQEAIA